jgi:hypothetical protein
MFQHMIQSFNASSLSQRLLLAIPLDFSLPAEPCEAGEAVHPGPFVIGCSYGPKYQL